MKNKGKYIIPNASLFEDLIWMSYRYCIGRKTIACCMHADELVSIVDQLPPKRRAFMAEDIRREINHIANLKVNVSIEGYKDNYDAYSLVWEYLLRHPEIKDDTKYHWYINIADGKVEIEKEEKKEHLYYESFLNNYCDMERWCKLASYLDTNKHLKICIDYDGKEEELICFQSMMVWGNRISKHYVPVERYRETPFRCQYVAPQFITKIESNEIKKG